MSVAMPEFVQLVRKFIRDFPKANELRGLAESTDSEIAMCVMLALDDYNTSPPPIRHVSLEAHPSAHLIVLGALVQLFLSNGILQLRNQLSYQDGGILVSVWDKGPAYLGNAQMIAQLWEKKKLDLKRSINIANGFGVVQSAEFNIYNYTAFFGGDFVTTNSVATPSGGLAIPSPYPNDPTRQFTSENVRHASNALHFVLPDWHLSSAGPDLYEYVYVHNLGFLNVSVSVLDMLDQDVTNSLDIRYLSENHLVIRVNGLINTFEGIIQCFVR